MKETPKVGDPVSFRIPIPKTSFYSPISFIVLRAVAGETSTRGRSNVRRTWIDLVDMPSVSMIVNTKDLEAPL